MVPALAPHEDAIRCSQMTNSMCGTFEAREREKAPYVNDTWYWAAVWELERKGHVVEKVPQCIPAMECWEEVQRNMLENQS